MVQAAPPPVTLAPIGMSSIEGEMKRSYLDYAMSVIISRALPDVRDGLKPVHRRILFSMYESGYTHSGPHRKSARMVGDVMGKYHPHGDSSIYGALARMAQPWSMRLPLIDGQGNFGSIDGDMPAAMRYTEARLFRVTSEAMTTSDLDEDAIDFNLSYDESEKEPSVLPARIPNILVNGVEGIAVGMSTRMPPHNLGEILDATLALIDDPDISFAALFALVPGPDFPTGGVVHSVLKDGDGLLKAAETGKGSFSITGVAEIVTSKSGKDSIVVTELPYQVNKATLVAKLGEMATDKDPARRMEGVAEIRDESSKGEIRVVIELKRDGDARMVMARMQKETEFSISFSVDAQCIDSERRPRRMGLRDILVEFVAFRRNCVRRRTRHRIEKTRSELDTQIGFFAAASHIDEVVRRIRASANTEAARASLMAMEFPFEGELADLIIEAEPDLEHPPVFRLSLARTNSILDLKMQKLTRLGQDEIAEHSRRLMATMKALLDIIQNPPVLDALMRREIQEIRDKFSMPRLTRIERGMLGGDSDEDLVSLKSVVLTVTKAGYVKYTPLDDYREQARGGKGKSGMDTKDGDVVVHTLACDTHTQLAVFTSRGIAHMVKVHRLPEAEPNARGRFIGNFIGDSKGTGGALVPNETIAAILPIPRGTDPIDDRFVVFVTDKGDVRRNPMSEFVRVNKGGKIAMKLEQPEDGRPAARLIAVLACREDDDLVLVTRNGKISRCPVVEHRVFRGRDSTGNVGIELLGDDHVIDASIIRHFEATAQERDAFASDGTTTWKDEDGVERVLVLDPARRAEMAEAEQLMLTVTESGHGKRFSTHEFRTTRRGAQGVWGGTFGQGTGGLVACFPVASGDGVVLMTDGGQVIRISSDDVKLMGRSTRGVILFDQPKGQKVVDVARIPAQEAVVEEA